MAKSVRAAPPPPFSSSSPKARSLLELVCDDHIDDSETFQTSAANATLAKAFGDPGHAEAKGAGGDSLDNFLPSSRISGRRRGHEKKSNATHVGKATRRWRKKQAQLVI
jgi:hypothetical protein